MSDDTDEYETSKQAGPAQADAFPEGPRIICEAYDPQHIGAYRRGDIHVIIASDLAKFTGLEMQYLDIIIFYSPCRDDGEYRQVVGRALRTGRDTRHTLYVYTLMYRSEQKERTIVHKDPNTVLPMW